MRMTLADIMRELKQRGIDRHRSWVQWLIQTGRINRPPLDSSGRYSFDWNHIQQILDYISRPQGSHPLNTLSKRKEPKQGQIVELRQGGIA